MINIIVDVVCRRKKRRRKTRGRSPKMMRSRRERAVTTKGNSARAKALRRRRKGVVGVIRRTRLGAKRRKRSVGGVRKKRELLVGKKRRTRVASISALRTAMKKVRKEEAKRRKWSVLELLLLPLQWRSPLKRLWPALMTKMRISLCSSGRESSVL